MARLIPLLLFLGLAVFLAVTARSGPAPARDPRAFRPKARSGRRDRHAAGRGAAPHLVRRTALAGLRDAYSGAALDPATPLVRCGRCLAFYHADSAVVLARENAGRCVTCGGSEFGAVSVTDG